MSLLFNMLSRFVIAFLPRASVSILCLQSSSTVILEPKKMKSVTVSIFPIYLLSSDGTSFHDHSFLNIDFLKITFKFIYFLLYNTVLVLPHIDMNLPQEHMSSQP